MQRFAVALTSSMPGAGVRRVVVESVAFLFKDAIVPPAYLLDRLFFAHVVTDAAVMEKIFAKSELDWTMVRPPQLTDKPYSGKYRMRVGHLPRLGFSISRADVANCFIRAVEDPASIRKVIGASN